MRSKTKLPSGWMEVKIGHIASEVNERCNTNGHYPVLSMTKYDGFVPSDEYFGRQVYSRELSNYKVVRRGQFAYATIHLDEGSIDLLTGHEAGLISPMYTVFEPDLSKVDPIFLRYLLKSNELIKRYAQIGQGSVNRRKSISFNILSLLRICLPHKSVQQLISRTLLAIDDAIEATQAVIKQTRQLKTALLQDLLTNGLPGRHETFVNVKRLGKVPATWGVVALDTLIKKDRPICYGILMPGRGHPNGIPVVKVKDIENGKIKLNDLLLTSPDLDEEYRRSRLKAGDLLLSIRGTTGRIAVVPTELEDANITQDTARISVKDSVTRDYLYYAFQGPALQQQIQHHTIGQAVKGINIEEVRRLSIPLPKEKERRTIAVMLRQIDEQLEINLSLLEQLARSKTSLSQGLLTGRIPVFVAEKGVE